MSLKRIGFIGLGAMGGPMARRVLEARHPLTVHDLDARRMEPLVSRGAAAAASPAATAAASEVIITMLPDSSEVQAVVFDGGGVLEGMKPGSILIEMSTIDPAVTRRTAAAVEAHGGRMLDAPIGRTSRHAEQGTLYIMVGGDRELFEECRPILSLMGSDITRCGPTGSGATMKLVNNVLTTTIIAANAEALVLGVAAGLSLDKMLEVLTATGASNTHLKVSYPEKALAGDLTLGFATRPAYKDLSLALRMAGQNRLPLPVGAAAAQLFAMARAMGHDGDDYTSVIRVLEYFGRVGVSPEGTAHPTSPKL